MLLIVPWGSDGGFNSEQCVGQSYEPMRDPSFETHGSALKTLRDTVESHDTHGRHMVVPWETHHGGSGPPSLPDVAVKTTNLRRRRTMWQNSHVYNMSTTSQRGGYPQWCATFRPAAPQHCIFTLTHYAGAGVAARCDRNTFDRMEYACYGNSTWDPVIFPRETRGSTTVVPRESHGSGYYFLYTR